MSINEVLKQARSETSFSQEDIAEKIGVSRQTVSNWENGHSYPDIASVVALSDVYGVSLDSLLKGDPKMIKHLEESTNVAKSSKQVIASIIALGLFLIGTVLLISVLGGSHIDFFNLPTIIFIIIFLVLVLTITRSFKLFANGFSAALFPRKERSAETREQAAKLFRLLSKITVIAAAITTLISLISMLMTIDYREQGIIEAIGGNIAAAFLSLFYGLVLALIFELVAYILRQKNV